MKRKVCSSRSGDRRGRYALLCLTKPAEWKSLRKWVQSGRGRGDWRLNTLTGTPIEITHISRKGNGKERKRSGATRRESISLKLPLPRGEEGWAHMASCSMHFCIYSCSSSPAALRSTPTQTHRKRHGILILGRFLQTFFLGVKVANQMWCPYKRDVISIRNRSWEVHHLRCLLSCTHPINITSTAGSFKAASRLRNINQTSLRTTVTIATFQIFYEGNFFLLMYSFFQISL